jgi:hypothetical protein
MKRSAEGGPRPLRFYVQDLLCEEARYEIESSGDSLAELIDNAVIHELSADDVGLRTLGLYDYADSIIRRGEMILAEAFLKGGNK